MDQDNIVTMAIRDVAAKLKAGVKLTQTERNIVINSLKMLADRLDAKAAGVTRKVYKGTIESEKHNNKVLQHRRRRILKELQEDAA